MKILTPQNGVFGNYYWGGVYKQIWLLSGFGKRNRFVQFFGFLGLLFKLTSTTRNVYSVEFVEDFNLEKKHVIDIILEHIYLKRNTPLNSFDRYRYLTVYHYRARPELNPLEKHFDRYSTHEFRTYLS